MKKYSQILVLLILALCLVSCATKTSGSPDSVSFADLPGYFMLHGAAMVSERLPAIQIALVDKGEIVYQEAFGLADKDAVREASNDTIFQVASISKSVTAWGLMNMAQGGLVDLDKPVQDYVKRWTLPKSKYNRDEVTVRRVMSHSAGLGMHGYMGYDPAKSPVPTLEDSLSGGTGPRKGIVNSGPVKLVRKPGSAWSYSGGGYTFLQLMMDENAPDGFSSFMKKTVLEPLGMAASTFEYSSALKPLLAKPYSMAGNELPNFLFAEKAAAGLYTTAGDLSRVLCEMYRLHSVHGYRGVVISPESAQLITTSAIAVAHSKFNESMGLGYFIGESKSGKRIVSHSGGNQGWKCFYGVELASGRGIVILTNSNAGYSVLVKLMELYRESLD